MRLVWSERARTDVRELRAYIARDSAFYARQFTERLLRRIEALQEFPLMGRTVPESRREDIREIIYRNYRIIYRVSDTDLLIVTVLHGSRDLTNQEPKPWD